MRRPYDGPVPVTRAFGIYGTEYANYPGSKHPGTDYGTGYRRPLYAVFEGRVRVLDRGTARTGRGREVRIFGPYQANYCHLDEIVLQDGQTVGEGALIGYSGWTGYVLPANQSGSHLHFEFLSAGQYIDPERIFNQIGGNEPEMTLSQAEELATRIGLLAHMSEAEITKDWLNYHAPRIQADPTYATALVKALYEGKQWQDANWKAVHYGEATGGTELKPGTYIVK